ncbi:hypothetical protein IE53DRAFT_384356 [Violaceomyces palustris]|uniref:Uncharacterized protein n=1 Tax=Violaceomyces palustris TaxID=1673888 RepID=A0ACD0P573_9BASI|nr:hypothetical protein IE53DRAFT_384356 [Violaceomyces palustris]
MPNEGSPTALARRAYLQAILSRRSLTESQSKHLHRSACKVTRAPYSEDEYGEFFDQVSNSLSKVGLEIRRLIDQETNVATLALINTKGDEMAQMATNYSASELAFIKRLIQAIFTAEDEAYSLTSINALRLGGELKPPMSKRTCEKLLENLVSKSWFSYSASSGRYKFSTRSILELEGYLRNEFPDFVLECYHCKNLVTKGLACAKPNCKLRLHLHCQRASIQSDRCSLCKSSWRPLPVGEESAGSGRKPKRTRRRASEEEEEEADELEQGEENGVDFARDRLEEPTSTSTDLKRRPDSRGSSLDAGAEEAEAGAAKRFRPSERASSST